MGTQTRPPKQLLWQAKVIQSLTPLVFTLHKIHQYLLSPEHTVGSAGGFRGSS